MFFSYAFALVLINTDYDLKKCADACSSLVANDWKLIVSLNLLILNNMITGIKEWTLTSLCKI